jgi:putative hydrolases of HD superfamily
MQTDLLNQYFTFANILESLKKLERFRGQYYWKDYPQRDRYESVADHSWRLAVLIILFSEKLEQAFDFEKAVKIALVHDIAEILAGDKSPMGNDGTGKSSHAYNKDEAKAKFQEESSAAQEIFANLPKDKHQEFYDLWLDYEEQTSYEAKIVKALDRIECMLQVLEYQDGHMFPQHLEFTINYGLEKSSVSKVVADFGNIIANKLKAKFKNYE